MNSKIIAIVAVMGCVLSSNLQAEEVAAVPSAAASVDLNRIQNEVGYQRLTFLDTSDEVTTEIMRLRTTLDQTLVECVKEEDEGKSAILQAKIQSINNKLNTIRSAMSSRGSDYRRSLAKFISSRYSGKYALIVDAQMLRSSGQIIWNSSGMIDLTDEIIQTLNQQLP